MSQNLKPLTSLRILAALWVVCFHFWPNLGVATPAFVDKGYLGVELFFVLSGFILSHVYLEAYRGGTFKYVEFIWARLARIYPLHIAVIAGLGLLMAALAVVGIKAGDMLVVWSSLPGHLTLTQAWGLAPNGGWNHPSWSISAEWFAYLTFPLFAMVFVPLWNRPRAAVAAAVAFMIALYIVFPMIAGFPLTRATTLWGALRIVPCFAYGVSLWLFWNAGIISNRTTALVLAGMSTIGLVAATSLQEPDFVSVIFCGGIILGLGAAAKLGSSVMSNPVMVWLGEVSFAVYMVCIPWQLVVTEGLQRFVGFDPAHMPLPVWLAMYAGVILPAAALHHLVERPAREWMRRMVRRPAVAVAE